MLQSLQLPEFIITILNNLYWLTVISVAVIILLENRNAVKTLSWILVLVLLPVGGLILYIFFGQNYRKDKIISRKSILKVEMINGYYDTLKDKFSIKAIDLPKKYENLRELISLLFKSNHAVYSEDNSVDILLSGKEKFDTLLSDLANAKRFIHLEYYIFTDDIIGNKVLDVLAQKVKDGIEVRMIVDDVGSWHLKKPFYKKVQTLGIEIYPFLEVRFPYFTSKINYRNHRKIIVIDGLTGYVGGMNVADRYVDGVKGLGPWRDIHLRISGSAVYTLQSIFILDWFFVSQQRISDKIYFPPQEAKTGARCQIAWSSPDSDWKTIEQAFFRAISTARKYMYIQTPYFLPTESLMMALKTSALSGIDVRIVIPGKTDAAITSASSRSYLRELLNAGVKVYFYYGGFLHAKLMISDDILASVGTSNMDFRSFESNFEVTSFLYDQSITKRLKAQFLIDLKESKEINLKDWRKRPLYQKLGESVARLFSPLM